MAKSKWNIGRIELNRQLSHAFFVGYVSDMPFHEIIHFFWRALWTISHKKTRDWIAYIWNTQILTLKKKKNRKQSNLFCVNITTFRVQTLSLRNTIKCLSRGKGGIIWLIVMKESQEKRPVQSHCCWMGEISYQAPFCMTSHNGFLLPQSLRSLSCVA